MREKLMKDQTEGKKEPKCDLESDHGIKLLFSNIDESKASEICQWILKSNVEKKLDHLTLIIHSYGGQVTAGFAIIDAIVGSRIPVYTVGLGMIASMGTAIFIAGKRGHRVLTPNTLVLTHQFTSMSWGKEHELIADIKKNDIFSKRLLAHHKRHTGLSDKAVREKLFPPSDVWLDAKQAKKLGLCDEVRVF